MTASTSSSPPASATRATRSADDGINTPPDHYASTQHGVSSTASLLLGFPLRPGLVLGAGGLVSFTVVGDAPVTRNGQHWSLVDVEPNNFETMELAGPFVDFYPSPSRGWHVQALVGYAHVSYAQITQNPFSGASPTGIGLMAGIGHDWWVSEHWSIGLLARFTYANVNLSPTPYPDSNPAIPSSVSTAAEHDTVVSPSLEASFTFH